MFNTLKKSSLTLLIASTALIQFGCGSDSDPDKVGNWYKKDMPSFGGIPRYGAVSFTIDNKGYIGGGYTNESVPRVNDFWQYDADNKIWKQVAAFPGVARTDAVAFVAAGKGYVGTGFDGIKTTENNNGYKKDFFQYDPTTNKWKAVADFGGVARQYASAFSVGDKGYVGLGYNASGLYQDFYEYNPTTDAWTEVATFIGGKRRSATAFTIGSSGYIGFGVNNSAATVRDLYQFTPGGANGKGAWSQKTVFNDDNGDFPTVRSDAFALVINEKAYIVGGAGNRSDCWEWNPTTDIWVEKTSFEGTGRSNAGGFVIKNVGYFGTGLANSTPVDDFWGFNPDAAVDDDDN